MSFNPSNEIEVEEVFSEDYINFLNDLDVVPVAFDFNNVIDELETSVFQENCWDEPIEIKSKVHVPDEPEDYVFDFKQPPAKYDKITPFQLIPQKQFIRF